MTRSKKKRPKNYLGSGWQVGRGYLRSLAIVEWDAAIADLQRMGWELVWDDEIDAEFKVGFFVVAGQGVVSKRRKRNNPVKENK